MSLSVSAPETPGAAPSIARPVTMQTGGGPLAYLRKVRAIATKDLRAELRAKEVFATMAAFSVLAVVVFGLAFDLRVPRPEMVVPGVLWVVLLFGGVLGLNRAFGAEVDRGSLAALLLAPVDRSAIFFGKLVVGVIFQAATVILAAAVIAVIFDVNLLYLWLLVGLVLGIVGYAGVGTLFAALTANVRARETMLPILLLPVTMPIFVAGVALTAAVLDGRPFDAYSRWLLVLAGYDLLFVTIAFLVFDLLWEEG